jgi:galactose mutarotase-like enzyme
MLITIDNGALELTVDTLGAQMMSLKRHGTEYLWQGDSAYWGDRAPILFPFIARLTNDSYKFQGKVYPMTIHGFANASEFAVAKKSADALVLELCSSEKTRVHYPIDFVLQVIFRLEGDTLYTTYRVENKSDVTMPFGIGGHPGFKVPVDENERFEDYYLEFSLECQPDRVGFTPAVYLSGHDEAYPLEAYKRIDLRHDLFDEDAIILKNMAREVTLRSKASSHSVTVSYPKMPYLGIWHWPHTDAPYVCIEPWSSLPSRQDVVEEFTCKSDLVQLEPGCVYDNTWTITIGGNHHD